MRSATERDYRERMLRVLVHIEDNLDAELSLADLAHVAAFSPYHFHRIFRGMVGESVKSHVRRLRLERAAARLKHGTIPVTTIAFDAGYETPEAFSRSFRDLMGASPSEFRSRTGTGDLHDREDPMKRLEPQDDPNEEIRTEVRRLEPLRVAFVRHVGPYEECGAAWDKLCGILGREGHLGGGPKFLGLCHDDPEVTDPAKLRYDACVTVDESFEPLGEIGVQTIAGGDYAITTHLGPFENLSETYGRLLGRWIPQRGRLPSLGPCFEEYLTDPESTEPEDLVTDVHVPLEPTTPGE